MPSFITFKETFKNFINTKHVRVKYENIMYKFIFIFIDRSFIRTIKLLHFGKPSVWQKMAGLSFISLYS